jgi:hypothetical protein
MLIEKYPLLLPASSKLFNDELLSSWLLRLSINHSLKPELFAKLLFPKFNIWHKDVDTFAPKEMLLRLSEMTLIPLTRIEDCLLSNYLQNLMPKGYFYYDLKWILPLGIVSKRRSNRGLMFCPSCLKKNRHFPYYKKSWRIALNVVCPECKIMLHDRCPKCHAPIIFYRNYLGWNKNTLDRKIIQCFYCDFDLRHSHNEEASEEIVLMQLEINRIIKEGWNEKVHYPHQYFDVLYHIIKLIKTQNPQFELFQNTINQLKKFPAKKIIDSHSKDPFNRYNVSERAELLFCAYWIMQDWPERFYEIIKKSNVCNKSVIKGFKDAPYWYLDILNR